MWVLFATFHDDDFVTWLPTEFRRLAQQGRNVRGVNCITYIYIIYIYIYSVGCWVAMETRRNPWVMGVSSGSDQPAYPTPSLSTPPHSFHPHPPVTPTLAQVNSFNTEYKSGTSDMYTCCAAVRHATSVCSPYIDGISKAGIRTYSRRIIKHLEA